MKQMLFSVMVGALLCSCEQEIPHRDPVRPVRMMMVEDKELLASLTFAGKAKAVEEVNLGFEVAGTIIDRPVDKGDYVDTGALLARLDPRDFQNELDAVTAELDRATAHRDRIAEALKANAVAKQDLTDAEARVQGAQAQVNIKLKALEDSVITAPFDGVIAWTFKERFQRVAAKELVVRLLDIRKIEFQISIPETMISYVPYIRYVNLTFDAFPGRTFVATVKEIGAEASVTTRTYPVTLLFQQPEDIKILPGMAGTAYGGEIAVPEKFVYPGHVIPMGAIFTDNAGKNNYVWIVDNYKVSRREVIVERVIPEGVEVRGLNEGERIVTAGVHQLNEGEEVREEKERRN